ncbi:hypothetical protein B0H13DRAFT_1852557 [Mycena leptocephala]|nr:hypothetical protein B0H13DRAFT_1852557 [Mycena leptocephala]
MAMMMAKFDTQVAFSEKDEQLHAILGKLDTIDSAGSISQEDLTAVRRQLSEGQNMIREKVDRPQQSLSSVEEAQGTRSTGDAGTLCQTTTVELDGLLERDVDEAEGEEGLGLAQDSGAATEIAMLRLRMQWDGGNRPTSLVIKYAIKSNAVPVRFERESQEDSGSASRASRAACSSHMINMRPRTIAATSRFDRESGENLGSASGVSQGMLGMVEIHRDSHSGISTKESQVTESVRVGVLKCRSGGVEESLRSP